MKFGLTPNRRGFLIQALGATAGLTLSLTPSGLLAQEEAQPFRPDALSFLTINPDGTATFRCAYCEMGQGVYTTLTSMIAEELDLEIEAFDVVQADIGDQYKLAFDGNWRMTAGSSAIRWTGQFHRQFGATARAMVIEAASRRLGVPAAALSTDNGFVVHAESGQRIGYGELAEDAHALPVPQDVPLKTEGFRYIGHPTRRADTPAKITGHADYGIDVSVPEMLHAAVVHAPVFGSEPKTFDPSPAQSSRGVVAVERLPGAVAVVAEKWWQAKAAIDRLNIVWSDHANATFSSTDFLRRTSERFDDGGVATIDEDSHDAVRAALASSARLLERVYEAPFLSHAQIEPGTAVARWNGENLELWVENQGPDHFMKDLAPALGISADRITFHTPFVGGAFGRRLHADLALEAALLARAVDRPVKVIWSREEDFKRDWFRPAHTAKLRAGLDTDGKIIAWHASAPGDGPGRWYFGFSDPDAPLDRSATEGLQVQGYKVPVKRVDYAHEPCAVQCGFWRSVGGSMNGFFRECFIDELAAEAGLEPVEFRRLNYEPRWVTALDRLVDMAQYRSGRYTGSDGTTRAMGFAMQKTFESIVGQIAEVSIVDGRTRVHTVWCVFDIGSQVVNPNITRQQIEGAIVMGTSAALFEELTFAEGLVSAENFDRYELARLADTPEIRIDFIETPAEQAGGVGEPGVPPVAPAIVNAVAKLTETRIRSLPLSKHDLRPV